MPTAELPGDLRMYYEDDDFSDPWREAETVIMHHGQGRTASSSTPGSRRSRAATA